MIDQTERSRIRGCLLGGALGDALGAPVEFLKAEQIAERFGPLGPAEMREAYGRVGAVTDDTQMTLWTAEGMLRGIVRGNDRGIGDSRSTLPYAYLRWLYTQDGSLPSKWQKYESVILGISDDVSDHASGWLINVEALHSRRAPGRTCVWALRANPLPSREAPINYSKGCGGVMRVAPVAMTGPTGLEEVFDVACFAAALTHGHPTGWLAAGAFAYLLRLLRDGRPLTESVDATIRRLRDEPHGGETKTALEAARRLGKARGPAHSLSIASLGQGWIAEEALAIAVYAALIADGDFEAGVRAAVNHSGDSDSTGSMAGQILGTVLGVEALPARWLESLELRDEIDTIAGDLAIHYRPDPEWQQRYPGY